MRTAVIYLLLVASVWGQALNPEVTQATIHQTICVRGWTKAVRPSEAWAKPVKLSLLRPGDNPELFQLDHKLPLELGGAPYARNNLQLQPWGGPCNAKDKDELEHELSRAVRTGLMELDDAQQEFTGDWRVSYQEWFGRSCER